MAKLARRELVKAILKDSTSDNHTLIDEWIDAASALANIATNRTLESTTYTDERYIGDGTTELFLNQYPCTALTAVKIWGGAAFIAETITDFELINGRVVVYPAATATSPSYYAWPYEGQTRYSRNVKITYTAGYAETGWDASDLTGSFAVPADLEQAIARLAAHLLMQAGQSGMSTVQYGPVSVTYAQYLYQMGIPPEIEAVFANYRRVRF